jgi:hypothetical protein
LGKEYESIGPPLYRFSLFAWTCTTTAIAEQIVCLAKNRGDKSEDE